MMRHMMCNSMGMRSKIWHGNEDRTGMGVRHSMGMRSEIGMGMGDRIGMDARMRNGVWYISIEARHMS